MSIRNISWGIKAAGDKPVTFMSLNLGTSGPVQACSLLKHIKNVIYGTEENLSGFFP